MRLVYRPLRSFPFGPIIIQHIDPIRLLAYITCPIRSAPNPEAQTHGAAAAAAAAAEEAEEGVGETKKTTSICTRLRGLVMRPRRSLCANRTLSPSTQGTASPAHRTHPCPCKSLPFSLTFTHHLSRGETSSHAMCYGYLLSLLRSCRVR